MPKAAKKGKRSAKKGGRKGPNHIPLEILEKRLTKLNRKVKARGGNAF